MDVLFVDLPVDFLIPVPTWCLGFRSMIAVLREEGFSAAILHPPSHRVKNARQKMIRSLQQANPAVVGFTSYDVHLAGLFRFIKDLRKAGLRAHITVGGVSASAIAERILASLPEVDSVVCGEGEHSIVDLAKWAIRGETSDLPGVCIRQGNQVMFSGPRPFIDNLDDLPLPVDDDFAEDTETGLPLYSLGSAPVAASRGCYGKCAFCCIQRFYRSCPGSLWRGRGAQTVVQEMAAAMRWTGSQTITFVDENFLGPGKLGARHALSLANELTQHPIGARFNFGCRANDIDRDTLEALKKAGLSAVTLGIESMAAETLRLFQKGITPETNEAAVRLLEDLQLSLEITFIFFHPLTALAEIRDNLNFIERVRKSPYAYFNRNMPFTEFIPFFGTEYTRALEEQGLVKRDLLRYSLIYQDPRVGLIARKVRSVPLGFLARLTHELHTRDPRLAEVLGSLREYEKYLNLWRLPELVSDLCDVYTQGGSLTGRPAKMIAAEFDQETARIQSMRDLLLSSPSD